MLEGEESSKSACERLRLRRKNLTEGWYLCILLRDCHSVLFTILDSDVATADQTAQTGATFLVGDLEHNFGGVEDDLIRFARVGRKRLSQMHATPLPGMSPCIPLPATPASLIKVEALAPDNTTMTP